MSSQAWIDSITDVVAIDGPAGAGKSTVARRAAAALGFSFLDTGAMYRAATWWALEQKIDLSDGPALAESTRTMKLDLREDDGVQQVLVNGHDITHAIRTPEITRLIHHLDSNREVRAHLVDLQRAVGAQKPVVAEGRDMGTVVFPKAKCKIYMDASLDERARRRAAELAAKEIGFDFDVLREEIRIRDEKTMTRAESPLRRADDAVLLDTTGLTLDEVVARVVEIAREKL